MKRLEIVEKPTNKKIKEKAKEIFDVQQKSNSQLAVKSVSQKDIERDIRKAMPRIGEVVLMENAQEHYKDLKYYARWITWKYAETYCIDIVQPWKDGKGYVGIGTIQSVGHSRIPSAVSI